MDKQYFIVGENAPRLDRYLAELMPERSRSFFGKRLQEGHVLVDGKPAKAKDKPKAGSTICILLPEPRVLDVIPEDIPLDIVYQDSDIAVINKPKGMVTHPAPGNYTGTLVNALMYHIADLSGINGVLRPGIVHRLDKDTTGLLVIAKNDEAHTNLQRQIQSKMAKRIYTALCYGNILEDTGAIHVPITRHPKDRKRMSAAKPGQNGRAATSEFEVLARYGDYTLVQVELKTGRTHQIRVHMAHVGNPVVGDELYTRKKPPFETEGQMLHAGELHLQQPTTGEWMEFRSPLPKYFQEILEKIEHLRR